MTSSPTIMKKNSYNFKNFRKAGITNIQTKPRSNQGGFIISDGILAPFKRLR